MPVRFTYANFPSLWDTIIGDADFAAQLVIRSIDHGLRDVIDRLMVRHLVLSPDMGNVVNVRGTHHRVPALKAGLVPGEADSNPNDASVTALCRHTAVLDLRGYFHPTFDVRPLAAVFPNLQVLRVCSDEHDQFTPYVPLGARSLVLFSSPAGLSGIYDHWYFRHPSESPGSGDGAEDGVRRLIPRGASRRALPDSYRRIVINLKGSHQPPARLWPIAAVPPAHIEEVVIIVPTYRSLENEGRMSNPNSIIRSVLAVGLLQLLRSPHVRYILVGLDEFRDNYTERFKELLFQDTAQLVHADVDYGVDDPLTMGMHEGLRAFAREASAAMRRAAREEKEPGGTAAQDGGGAQDEGDGEASEGLIMNAAEEAADIEDGTDDAARHVGEAEDVEGKPLEDSEAESGSPAANGATDSGGSAVATPEQPELASAIEEPADTGLVSLQEKVNSVFSRIEFLTKDEYVERVGEETAALEMLEYLNPKDYPRSPHHSPHHSPDLSLNQALHESPFHSPHHSPHHSPDQPLHQSLHESPLHSSHHSPQRSEHDS